MLAALRIAAVIGLIFYLSPVRDRGGPTLPLGEILSGAGEVFGKAGPAGAVASEDDLWEALPSAARQRVLDHVLSRSVAPPPPAPAEVKPALPRDTLELEDLEPPWRGEAAAGQAAHVQASRGDNRRKPVAGAPAASRTGAEKKRS